LIGAIGCAVGIIVLAVIPDGFKLGDVTIHGLIEKSADVNLGTCYAAMGMGAVLCAGECVLAKFAKRYFVNELEASTPFTFDGSKELIKLGILTICIPLGTTILAALIYGTMTVVYSGNIGEVNLNNFGSVALGVTFIIVGLLCRHGAEISDKKAKKVNNENTGN
ncbi:MAG: hypothetical protein K6F88_05505, partial [Ruminococcus sp.]|nr:hypothetical protein [Ruminococcus sp.]